VWWDLATASGDGSGSRGDFTNWLRHAQSEGHCDEVLVSFKGHYVHGAVNGVPQPAPGERCPDRGHTIPPCDAPAESLVAGEFKKFLEIDWRAEAGFTGSFAFTPWNEPNNEFDAGNGLGKVIAPDTAAKYYLSLMSLCRQHGCKVAAGDLASNGDWPRDFEWNCANDSVKDLTVVHADGKRYCKNASSENPGNKLEPSYLDYYKHYIVNNAADYGLGNDFHAPYFAFHGWHDANGYFKGKAKCTNYGDCVTRRVLKSLGGSHWGATQIWDTEVGASQGDPIGKGEQACVAAFVMHITTVSRRITRLYYTRLHGGAGEIVGGTVAHPDVHPALGVLASRETRRAGCAAF
jgi:hypothetical protein